MRKPEFPVFMDPAEAYPVGSTDWAGRICSRLLHEFERVDSMGLKPFLKTLKAAIPKEPATARPWHHWPPDNPWRDYQSWSQSLFGLEFERIIGMVKEVEPEAARELLAIIADEQRTIKQGRRKAGEKVYNVNHLGKGNAPSYLLRRLARARPDLLDAYERGEFKSARSAAKAAGFVTARAVVPSEMTLEELAAQLRRRFDADQRRRLAELLMAD